MTLCFVFTRLDDNMNRFVVSVHKTEIGAAKAMLEKWIGGDMDLFWQTRDEKFYDEQFPDGITEGEVYENALAAAAEEVVADLHGGLKMHIWEEEQGYGYDLESYVLEE